MNRLLSRAVRGLLEETVSGCLGRAWRVRKAQDMSDFAYHPCAILSDGSFAVFAKYSQAPQAEQQFKIEQAHLHFLSDHAGVLIPTPIDILPTENGTLFIMEALDAVERAAPQWRQMGRTLARIHRVQPDYYGFHTDNFFGPLPQDNTPVTDWAAFYAERRL